ncbi:hypothetical protein INS49_011656 [Diaporthe citri]|uniref:uncharacterized protein n=1 Tax=Diaporthe citri TaxID=83186 RepID=UPI001C7EF3BC|nr:uncharacterized protein INS49_011656 [Diaporthe citri]KAG6360594.1 hypothetical protein INS49_011656 [Diaporthe citri]
MDRVKPQGPDKSGSRKMHQVEVSQRKSQKVGHGCDCQLGDLQIAEINCLWAFVRLCHFSHSKHRAQSVSSHSAPLCTVGDDGGDNRRVPSSSLPLGIHIRYPSRSATFKHHLAALVRLSTHTWTVPKDALHRVVLDGVETLAGPLNSEPRYHTFGACPGCITLIADTLSQARIPLDKRHIWSGWTP